MKDKEFINYANSFQAIARLELESIRLLLDYLDHPERDLKFIHVAGTNGKGSVCAFLQCILTDAGYRTGKYISPNMISVCERISIDGEDIKEEELHEILNRVQLASDKVEKELGGAPTQFEIWTAAAFCYFKEKNCDIVVLEVGLGGARDATNVIDAPLMSIITRIALDHTEYLGNTLFEVATQKAGIIKEHADGKTGVTITTTQDAEVKKALAFACEEKKNELIITKEPTNRSYSGTNELFSYDGISDIKCGISGVHQVENACIAVEATLKLGISEKSIKTGISKARNIGRFELIKKEPTVIFDGAHNPDGMKALIASLRRYYPDATPVFVMGAMGDKDISGVIFEIKKEYPDARFLTVGVKDNPRAASACELAEKIRKEGLFAESMESIEKALEEAEEKNRLIVICGSLYLYKDLME